MKNLYVCVDSSYIKINEILNDQNICFNESLENTSNHYIFKSSMKFITNNKDVNTRMIIGWTSGFTDDCYNEVLKHFTISKGKYIQLHDLDKEKFGFIKNMYYDELNEYSTIFFEKFRKDWLYNIMLKLTFITSLDIALKYNGYEYIFLDNAILSPVIIKKMLDRKPLNHLQYYFGTLSQYERLLRSDTKYILYKNFKKEMIE